MTRERYIHQLETLREDLLRLGSMVEHALIRAMRSLETWNTTVAAQVLSDDEQIDEARRDLENRVTLLLATQQPVAGDLRLVGSVFAIASELERIGDYACGIARRVQRITQQPALIAPPAGIYEMSNRAQKMLKISLDAFVRLDVDMAQSLSSDEDYVDMMETRLHDELIAVAKAEPKRIEAVVAMIDVVNLLERVADRSTNIGERVIYMATSEQEDLNP
jgi:phosphate transport system protein